MAFRRPGLAVRRKAAGFSQEALADALGVERSTVVRWERGATAPQPWHRPRLARALKLSLDELDELLGEVPGESALPQIASAPHAHTGQPPRPEAQELSDMNRREMVRLLAVAGLYVGAIPGASDLDDERLEYAAAHPGQLDEATLSEYATLNNHLWRVFVLSNTKATTFPLVRQQLDVLIEAVKASPSSSCHAKLCGLIGDLAQLAGEILFDGNQYTDAAHCYSVAASASKEAGAYDLWACAITRHAFIGVYERKFQAAVPLLDLATKVARHGDSALSTRHWVSAVRAQAQAGLGDRAACEADLDRAAAVRCLAGPSQNGGWLRFDGSRLAEERGTCYAVLKRPDLAERAISDALRQNLSSRRHSSVLVDLAAVCAQRRDVDQMIERATAAVDIARSTHSGVVTRRLQLLQPQLLPFMNDRRVSRLGQEIRQLADAYQ